MALAVANFALKWASESWRANVEKVVDLVQSNWDKIFNVWSFWCLTAWPKIRAVASGRVPFYILLGLFAASAIATAAWQFRVSRYNQFWGLKRSLHCWSHFTTSAQPLYCSSCEQLICGFWLFRNTGWQCLVCGRASHLRCLVACETFECKCPSHPDPIPHHFVPGNLPTEAVCSVCGIICSSPFGLYGLMCLWCHSTVHEKCIKYLPVSCDFGTLRTLILPPSLVRLKTSQKLRRMKAQKTVPLIPSASRTDQLQEPLFKSGSAAVGASVCDLREGAFSSSSYGSDGGRTESHATTTNDNHRRHRLETVAPSDRVSVEQVDEKPPEKRYRRAWSLSEGLTQIQEAMAAGLSEGLKEVTGGVRRWNAHMHQELKRKILRSGGDAESVKKKRNAGWWQKYRRMEVERLHELAKLMPATADVWQIEAPVLVDSGNNTRHFDVFLRGRTPLLVFVNSRSGGQVGGQLLKEFYKLLNPVQVVDVRKDLGPRRALDMFRPVAMAGKLRVLVCGGDGTVGWVIESLKKAYGDQCRVPVAILPLGTGNDLARVLGWGATFTGDLLACLVKIKSSQMRFIDAWNVTISTLALEPPPLPSSSDSKTTAADSTVAAAALVRLDPGVASVNNLPPSSIPPLVKEESAGRTNSGQPPSLPFSNVTRPLTSHSSIDLPRNESVDSLLMRSQGLTSSLPAGAAVYAEAPRASSFSIVETSYLNNSHTVAAASGETDTPSPNRRSSLDGDYEEDEKSGSIDRPSRKSPPPCRERFRHHNGKPPSRDRQEKMCHRCQQDLRRRHRWAAAHRAASLQQQQSDSGTLVSGDRKHSVGSLLRHSSSLGPAAAVSSKQQTILSAVFHNYLDIGVAARIALKFHTLREAHPELFQSRLGNKFLYGEMGVREWIHFGNDNGAGPASLSGVRVYCDGLPVLLPEKHVEGLIVVNIPSFSGGVDLWGSRDFDVPVFESHRSSGLFVRSTAAGPPAGGPPAAYSPGNCGSSKFFCDICGGHRRPTSSKAALAAGDLPISPYQRRSSVCREDATDGADDSSYEAMSGNDAHTAAEFQSDRVASSSGVVGYGGAESKETTIERKFFTRVGGLFCRWQRQSCRDEIIEVVAVRSLFHLGQVQVGLAEPLRICQGRDIVLEIPHPVALQVDGEPRMLPAKSTIRVAYGGKSSVLCPTKPVIGGEASFTAFEAVLDLAVSDHVITVEQRNLLMTELLKRM